MDHAWKTASRCAWPSDSALSPALFLVLSFLVLGFERGAVYGLDAPVSANVASLFVGEQKIVEGRVLEGQRHGNTVRLRFGNGVRDFTVSLVVPLLSNFPADPERAYVGKTVRVVGIIKDFRGAPEMVIRDAGDIQIVDGSAPAGAAPASDLRQAPVADTPSRVSDQIERLDERLRRMDDRLRALEEAGPAGRAPLQSDGE